jgi:hypothetical protein
LHNASTEKQELSFFRRCARNGRAVFSQTDNPGERVLIGTGMLDELHFLTLLVVAWNCATENQLTEFLNVPEQTDPAAMTLAEAI